ncbi:HAD family hydrolase [Orenia marismortui]|uniref:Putative hydrolase of the HAD superfamily n=1 Tax=Orenia marismortui TaxID=46469 RepID=A0A4R8HFY4_9FIRM|nr:HAD-IA family hydrolase [Orenia marismortui]TDX58932.1 putative hydrolase of the HAD superfamily [Orenia marismortui]
MIKAIIFDLDDTLYYELEHVKSGFRAVSNYISNKYKISAEDFYNQLLAILADEGRGKTFNLALEEFNLPLTEVKALVEVYRQHKPDELNLYHDAKNALKEFSDKYKLGLITDGISIVQWNKIKALGIENRFEEIIVSDDHGMDKRKPSSFPYLKILEDFSVEAEEAIYIGDNPNKDFVTAKKLGLMTIRILRPKGMHINKRLAEEYEADYEIESLDELEEIICQ